MGIREPICHSDFYFNTGKDQPGCIFFKAVCSHIRAVDFYTESLTNPEAFYGKRCASLEGAMMGNCDEESGAFVNADENEVKKLEGIFDVKTGDKSPYGRGRSD